MKDRDSKGRGIWFKGEANHNCKLTDQDVLDIRADPRTQRCIAADYDISQCLVSQIKSRKRRTEADGSNSTLCEAPSRPESASRGISFCYSDDSA
jgi:hypothetical protein